MFKFLGRLIDETSELIGDITGLNKLREKQEAKAAQRKAAHHELNVALKSVLEEELPNARIIKLSDLDKA